MHEYSIGAVTEVSVAQAIPLSARPGKDLPAGGRQILWAA